MEHGDRNLTSAACYKPSMRVLLVVVVACVSIACNAKSDSGPSASAGAGSAVPETKSADASPAKTPAAAAPTKLGAACNLVTKEEAIQFMGAEVKEATGSDNECLYGGAKPMQTMVIRVEDNGSKDYAENLKVDVDGPGDKVLTLPDAKAYRRESGLIFGLLKRGTYVSVVASGTEGVLRPAPAVVDAQIKKMISRLPLTKSLP